MRRHLEHNPQQPRLHPRRRLHCQYVFPPSTLILSSHIDIPLAVWISPVSRNYEGERTPYGDAYHGYWIADASQLNGKFGTSDDLKALSDEVHKRGMYLMVDVVVNDVMSLSNTSLDYSSFLFQDPVSPSCALFFCGSPMRPCAGVVEKCADPDLYFRHL